jgi:hypothetical protein
VSVTTKALTACLLALALPGLSCGPGKTSSQTATPADMGSDAWPTDDEVREYLDGKSLPLTSEQGQDGKQGPPITIRRANIVALEVNKTGVRSGGDPWSTSATFLYDDLGTKYAIEVRVSHRKIGDKRAFFGLEVARVAKQ